MSLYTMLGRERFSPAQWVEIIAGAEQELDFLFYANPIYTAGQMEQIRIGLEQGLEVSVYADPAYTEKQMCCLRKGLSHHINPASCADPAIPEDEMAERVNQLIHENQYLWDKIPVGVEVARYVFEEGCQVFHLREDGGEGPAVMSPDEFKHETGLFAIHTDDSSAIQASKNFSNERLQEQGFLSAELDRFGIYEMRVPAKNQVEALVGAEAAAETQRSEFRLCHHDYLKPGDTLETICHRFQSPAPPFGFHSRALKAGDVIALQEGGTATAYLIKEDGFIKLPHFWQSPMPALNDGHFAAYQVGEDQHLTIAQESGGFAYTLYANDFIPANGGYARTETLEAALVEAAAALSLEKHTLNEINYEEFRRVAQLSGQEPTVRIIRSASPNLQRGTVLPLSEADSLFEKMDREQSHARQAPDLKGWPYLEVKYELEYMLGGKLRHHTADQFLGDGDGGIISHINTFYTTQRNDKAWQDEIAKRGDRDRFNAGYDYALQVLVPYLKYHAALTQWASSVATRRHEENSRPEGADRAITCACEAVLEHIELCRREHNTAFEPEFPPTPEMRRFYQDPEMALDRVHICREIWHEAHSYGLTPSQYAACGYTPPGMRKDQETPRPYHKPPRRPKHRGGPER